jgi:UDP-N-acetylglucosamine 2-epimerase (non-hydrolysing)
MTLIFAYGTSAELIKYSPILSILKNNADIHLWNTSQQGATVLSFERSYGISGITHLSTQPEKSLDKRSQVPKWALNVSLRAFKKLRQLKKGAHSRTKLAIVVHGDTMTSTLMAFIGWITRVDVIHVEAGLRSGSLRHPFPEELCRRATAYLASVHFAPNVGALKNLAKRKGTKINTLGNTAQDALLAVSRNLGNSKDEPFALVTLHRSELLGNLHEIKAIFKSLSKIAISVRLRLVLDELAMANIPADVFQEISSNQNIQILSKLPHNVFVDHLMQASYVITDSGGIQEECAVLGKPCLVHRKSTERLDGIGENALLSSWDQNVVKWFSFNYDKFVRDAKQPEFSPSEIVVDALKLLNYVG